MNVKVVCVGFLIILVLCLVHSELPDPPCGTNIYLEVGEQGTVHCRFPDFNFLGWINVDGTPEESTPFIYFENSEKKGRGYTSGDYDILPDGSLVINNVKLKHEFNFTVSLTPPVGRRLRFFVPVSVFVRPDPEYPVVNGLTNQQFIVQDVELYSGSINCRMSGVRPRVELEWVYQSDVISVENEPPSVTSNADETYNTTLSSRFTITDRSVGHITLQCRVAGEMADLFPSVTTIYLLNLNKQFPVVNGLARQQHPVLHLKREDVLTCTMNRVSKDVSLEWVIVTSGLANEIIFKDDASAADNGDGTSNITLTSSFSVMSSSVHHVTLQCRVSGQGANLYPDVTTVEVLFSQILPIPVIEGCYSQQEDCTLKMPRDGTLTCSVIAVPVEYTMYKGLDIFADYSGLSLTRIKDDHLPHISGDYDLTTSYQYTVDEASTESVIQCSLSGVKNNQPLNSTASARIIWQGTASDSSTRGMFALIIVMFVLNLTLLIIIIIILLVKKKHVKTAVKYSVPDPENRGDIAMGRTNHGETQESQTLLNNVTHPATSGSSSHSSDVQLHSHSEGSPETSTVQ